MKRKVLIALTFALTATACSHGGGNDAAMIAAGNVYSAAHPTCQGLALSVDPYNNTWFLTSTYPDRASGSLDWASAFEKAGLLRRSSSILGRGLVAKVFTTAEPGHHYLVLTQKLTRNLNGDNMLCVGHPVADSIAKAEPVGASYAAYGYSKDALLVEFRSHLAYADWARDPAVQSAIWNQMLDAKTKSAAVPSFSAILYDDPVRGWLVYSSGQ